MSQHHTLRNELKEKFSALARSNAIEEKFIELAESALKESNSVSTYQYTLEILLDLSLAVVDYSGYTNRDPNTVIQNQNQNEHTSSADRVLVERSYDADDEGLDEILIFPCHLYFDDCHPEILHDYHRENLRSIDNSTQVIKLSKLCEFVVGLMFKSLRELVQNVSSCDDYSGGRGGATSSEPSRLQRPISDYSISETDSPQQQLDNTKSGSSLGRNAALTSYLSRVVASIKKLNKICSREKRNCRILSRTDIVNFVLRNTLFLTEELQDRQHIFLEPMLKFVLTLADYKLTGSELKLIFELIKNEKTDLKVVLKNIERLLSHQMRILRNIQPLKSINFPVASKTAEEIEFDSYIANSWHWRIRSKVIEFKRKRSRADSYSSDTGLANAGKPKAGPPSSEHQGETNDERAKATTKTSPQTPVLSMTSRITPSWLECSIMTPLSNISPLIHSGETKFCCSMWISVCGDLLVIDRAKQQAASKTAKFEKGDDGPKVDWSNLTGHWLRLTSRRRLFRRYRSGALLTAKTRKRRLSAKIRQRQVHDKEDDEREEKDDKVRRLEAEANQVTQASLGGIRYFRYPSNRSTPIAAQSSSGKQGPIAKRTTFGSSANRNDSAANANNPPKEFLGRRARENLQEFLIHLVSFAIDSLTIEIWLNVKCMTFCARACRVNRDGQTNLLDQVTFPSHLQANGSWSNIMFCLEEQNKAHNSNEKVMNMKVLVNGIHKEKEKLVYGAHKSPLTNFALLIGCERSTFGYVWKLSQINIYKNMPDKNMPIYLLGKGPDFWSFTNFRKQSTLLLPDLTQRYTNIVVHPKVLARYNSMNEEDALNWITQNIVISYVAHQPDHFLDYSPTITTPSLMNRLPADYELSNSAERFIQARALKFSRTIKFNHNVGFGSALVEVGGIESMLICFAEVIRRAHEAPNVHSLAFSVLLKMSQTNIYHLNKFQDELNGLKLAEFLLVHPECIVSKSMLEIYLDFCIMKRGEYSLIKSPKLIYNLLTCWRAWHKDLKVARLLYRRLTKLLQPVDMTRRLEPGEHKLETYYINHNFCMIANAGGIEILMGILRECLVPLDDFAPHIDHELVELIVNLISLLIKHPPGLDVMFDIMEFLLFLHPDEKAYVDSVLEKSSFLHTIQDEDKEKDIVFDEPSSRVRTPLSETSINDNMSLNSSSAGNLVTRRGKSRAENRRHVNLAPNSDGCESNNYDDDVDDDEKDEMVNNVSRATIRSSSDEDLFRASEQNRISEQCFKNLAKYITEYNLDAAQQKSAAAHLMNSEKFWQDQQQQAAGDERRNFTFGGDDDEQNLRRLSILQNGDVLDELLHKCDNRNYAIANIADMLASIVKLSSTDPLNILSEALQKPIIDTRKLVVLANNDSPLVREKVLRLFLYCIRACYSLNLKTLLSKHEQNSKSPNFKICIPIQLIGRQLLKYTTTSRMIQLCYGIIVGIDDFETVDSVCLTFDIELTDNHLQLNVLVLLIQLLTQLRSASDILPALEFALAYVKQLNRLGEESTVLVLIKSHLVDCAMKLYFAYVENEINYCRKRNAEQRDEDDDDDIEDEEESSNSSAFRRVAEELDNLLAFIVQFFIQNLPTEEANKSVGDLVLYFKLLNTHIPPKYQFILRERQVKILATVLEYCKQYETCARQRLYNSKVYYHLKSFFKSNGLTKFKNVLPSNPSLPISNNNCSSRQENLPLDENELNENGHNFETADGHEVENGNNLRDSSSNESSHSSDQEDEFDSNLDDSKSINESDVIKRFRFTFELIVNFITTRETGVIVSPPEREFIIRSVRILSGHLFEVDSPNREKKSQWTLMLAELKASLKFGFSRLILFLLSPCDSTNLDERRYYAHNVLNMFSVDQLLNLLKDDSNKTNYRVLISFVKDLVDFAGPITQDFDGNSDSDDTDDALDDTESKLLHLLRKLETEVSTSPVRSNRVLLNKRNAGHLDGVLLNVDSKCRAIWLADLFQEREEVRERILGLKADGNQLKNLSSTEDLIEEPDRFLDEAVSVTREVVDNKHEQRKAYLRDLKQDKVFNYNLRQQWLSLIIGHTHDRAIWYVQNFYPSSWEQNPVEGPSRTRRRLRPCKLNLHPRFLRQEGASNNLIEQEQFESCTGGNGAETRVVSPSRRRTASSGRDYASNQTVEDCGDCVHKSCSQQDLLVADDWHNQYSPHPLCLLVLNSERNQLDSNELRIRMFTTDRIHFNCDCSFIRPNEVCDGEVSIASWCIHFIGERNTSQNRKQFFNDHYVQSPIEPDKTATSSLVGRGPSPPTSQQQRRLKTPLKSSQVSSRQPACNLPPAIVEDLWFDEIVEIWDRRYQLQDVGLEIFLTNNMTYLMSFRSHRDREDFKQHLMREQYKMINLQRFNLNTSLNRLTQLWRDGKLNNFDYLTCLNKLAGRSFNDLMQYPVFPFVLSNYTSEILDLNSAENFRKLKRPMAVQNEDREENFKNNYQLSQVSTLSVGPCGMTKPYHYSNHYSNSATVLHFLVRLPPFTQMLIQYQDDNFDQPDRTFHSMANTWQLITRDSNTDFKELIPEFFFLPEMFTNIENLNLGKKQNNEIVDDVRLPPWCPDHNSRLFTLIHRQALESPYVSENLHNWIDLIFGYKQIGKAAIDAINVFHPATYYGEIDLGSQSQLSTTNQMSSRSTLVAALSSARSLAGNQSSSNVSSSDLPPAYQMNLHQLGADNQTNSNNDSSDATSPSNNSANKQKLQQRAIPTRRQQAEIDRSALETMIKTYGQMPRQLFAHPMKQRSFNTFVPQINEIQLETIQQQELGADEGKRRQRLEPLKSIKGLRWGSFVGSPDDSDIIAVKHQRLISVEPQKKQQQQQPQSNSLKRSSYSAKAQHLKFYTCLLPNGDVAVLKHNTSLMLDYRADRKSSSTHQLSLQSTKYSRRAGLSNVGRMNLFSNMIISRQQFSFQEPTYGTSSNQMDSLSAASASLVSFTGANSSSRAKFSQDSLSLLSWFYLDGTIRMKHPAAQNQRPSVPLMQANTIVDTMTVCTSVPELNLLLVGYKSGSIYAHIVSTSYETAPLGSQFNSTAPTSAAGSASSSANAAALSSSSAAPSAVHFLHTTTSPSMSTDSSSSSLGPGRVSEKSVTGEPYTAVSLAGKTLHSVRSMNKTSRLLHCHSKRVNCIKFNVSFGIVVTGSDDGLSVIWDLNSLTYVRTIDYKFKSLNLKRQEESKSSNYCTWTYGRASKQRTADYLCLCDCSEATSSALESPNSRPAATNNCSARERSSAAAAAAILNVQACCICQSGVSLVAISDTLGDIVTIKDINNRLACSSDPELASSAAAAGSSNIESRSGSRASGSVANSLASSETAASTESCETSLTSIIYVHTINGSLVGFVNCQTQVTAVCYSNAPEGVSVNVIVVGMADGLVRLYSSWDLSRVKEFRVSGLCEPINSLLYSRDSQHLYLAYDDGQLVVLRNKKKKSTTMPKEWYF